MYVLYESSLQILADNPSDYWKDIAYTRFIPFIHTVWDTTIVLHAKAGEYLVTARKKGTVGMTEERELKLSLSFLDNRNYVMANLTDGAMRVDMRRTIRKPSQVVLKKRQYNHCNQKRGGWAAILTPGSKSNARSKRFKMQIFYERT